MALGRIPPPVKPVFEAPRLDADAIAESNERLKRMRTAIAAGASVEDAARVSAMPPAANDPEAIERQAALIALPGTDVAEALTRGSDNKALAAAYKARRSSIQLPPGVER